MMRRFCQASNGIDVQQKRCTENKWQCRYCCRKQKSNRFSLGAARQGKIALCESAIQCKSLPPVINWMKSKPGTGPNSDAPYYWRASIGDYQHRLRITSCLLTGDVFMANDDKFFFVSFLFSFPCSFVCASLSVPVLLSTALVVQCRLINLCWNIRISPSAVECHDFSFWYFGMRKKSDKWPFSAAFFDFLFIITSTCCHNHGGLTVFGWQRKRQQHNRGKKKMTWSFWSRRLWMKWIFHWESEERHFWFLFGLAYVHSIWIWSLSIV